VHEPVIAIRSSTVADLELADDILKAAFRASDSFQMDLQRYMAIQPNGWLFATCTGAPAGMVGAMDYSRFAYIGLMAVHPTMQGRGIGRTLMQQLLTWLDMRGTPMTLLDATEAGRPLYASLGFHEQDDACVFVQQHTVHPTMHTAAQVQLLQPQDLPAVMAFDRPVFGAERGAVLRALLTDFPERFFVVHDDAGEVSGYCYAQIRRLGPWVARQPTDAEALLQAALALSYAGAPQVIVPQMNRAGVALLERYGFHLVRTTRHMRRCGVGLPGQRELLYGQVSFAIG